MKRVVAIATVLAFGVLMATAAGAQSTVKFTVLGADKTVNLHINNGGDGVGNPYNSTAIVGRFKGQFENGKAVYMFCVDARHFEGSPFQTLDATTIPLVTDTATGFNATEGFYKDNTYGGVASAMTKADYIPTAGTVPDAASAATRASQAAYLVDKWVNSITATNVDFAKVQLAIWDILQDGGDGLAAGSFTSTSGYDISAILTDASSITSSYTGSAIWIEAQRQGTPRTAGNHVQDWAYSCPVPEPVFLQFGAMMGLGGVGVFRLRRKV